MSTPSDIEITAETIVGVSFWEYSQDATCRSDYDENAMYDRLNVCGWISPKHVPTDELFHNDVHS